MVYATDASVLLEENLTLYAAWEARGLTAAGTTYTPDQAHTGAGWTYTPASGQAADNTVALQTGDVPVRFGYRFTGWNTKADGSGMAYASGETYAAAVGTGIFDSLTQGAEQMVRAGTGGKQVPEAMTDDPLGDPLLYYRINNCRSIDELRQLTTAVLTGETAYWRQKKEGRDSEPVRIAKQYVQAHLERQITLEEVAACGEVRAGYLGILFKQKTGSNFSDYVIEARMEKAKELLRDTQLTIAAVAGRVGYADARHFSKVFQKTYQIKPTMYRKFYS